MRFTAKILPVMCVNTLGFVMLLVVRTPLCFEVKHVEALLLGHFVDERGFYVRFGVREGAKLFVFARLQTR